MKFYIVDAFTENLFGGNPAGVVFLEDDDSFPSDETMKKTAAELRYSETAFIKRLDEDTFQTRYFTPTSEVPLCGHATIASFWALLQTGLVNNNQSYRNDTLAGKLAIEIKDDFVWMQMGTPEYISQITDQASLEELYSAMGLQYSVSRSDLYPALISTGLPDIILPVATKEDLWKIKPDFPVLSALSERYQVVGVHAFTLDPFEDGALQNSPLQYAWLSAHCRNFAPLYGIDEESATGTSNGALTYFLYQNGILNKEMQCKFTQGEALNRPSNILTQLTIANDSAPFTSSPLIQIKVGGAGVILAQGTINLSLRRTSL